jgi:hypothetical protein
VGYDESPQRYIVQVIKESVTDTWTFNQRFSANAKQIFQHQVSVEFIQISSTTIDSQTTTPTLQYNVPSDFWYPFKLQSSAFASLLPLASALAATLALAIL